LNFDLPTLRYACRIDGDYVSKLAQRHYESRYNPPRKAFDFYSAAALVRHMQFKDLYGLPRRELFYSDEYGMTLVSESDEWEATLGSYVSRIDTKVDAGDSDFVRTKKEYFQREISIMQTIPLLPHLRVKHQIGTKDTQTMAADKYWYASNA
jgi:hypothetical protein